MRSEKYIVGEWQWLSLNVAAALCVNHQPFHWSVEAATFQNVPTEIRQTKNPPGPELNAQFAQCAVNNDSNSLSIPPLIHLDEHLCGRDVLFTQTSGQLLAVVVRN